MLEEGDVVVVVAGLVEALQTSKVLVPEFRRCFPQKLSQKH
jgi:hypothetical protein